VNDLNIRLAEIDLAKANRTLTYYQEALQRTQEAGEAESVWSLRGAQYMVDLQECEVQRCDVLLQMAQRSVNGSNR
jgi:hypothetical protein